MILYGKSLTVTHDPSGGGALTVRLFGGALTVTPQAEVHAELPPEEPSPGHFGWKPETPKSDTTPPRIEVLHHVLSDA